MIRSSWRYQLNVVVGRMLAFSVLTGGESCCAPSSVGAAILKDTSTRCFASHSPEVSTKIEALNARFRLGVCNTVYDIVSVGFSCVEGG